MGSRGPAPKPTARRRNKRKVTGGTRTERPVMPRTLPDEAQKEWRRVVPVLLEMGVLTPIDRAALIRYCTAWAEWLEVQDAIARTGKLIKGRTERVLVRNPLLFVRRDLEQTLDYLCVQLNLTPTSRLRNGIKHEPPAPVEDDRISSFERYKQGRTG